MVEGRLATLFRHRSTFLLLATWPVVVWSLDGRTPPTTQLSWGIAVAGCGVLLRLAAVRRIGRGARVHRAHASAGLIESGPFARTRNPLYIAAGLMLCGLGLVAGGGSLAALLPLLVVAVYTPVVRHEERALGALIGSDYDAYARRVPRWIGARSLRLPARSGPRVAWSEVMRRERWLVPGVVAAVVGILAIGQSALTKPLGSWNVLLATVGLLLGAVCNSWLVERKRRRRSRSARAVPFGAVGES
ncbi:MAG: methyltransferase family protein [Myxococcota bacterium]